MSAYKVDPPFRAEHVGSLLRPRLLKDAGRALADGTGTRAAYEDRLNREVARIVKLQEDVGLQSITDGEFGRTSWFGFFFERLQGFSLKRSAFTFHDAEGTAYEWMTCYAERRMRRLHPICGDEFRRLRALTRQTPKANMPSPSALHFFRGDACRDKRAYPDLEEWWDDLVAIYQDEIRDLGDTGCTYLQLDEVPLGMLCDPSIREHVAASGSDPGGLIDTYVAVVNRVLESKPAGMTVGMHVCRGNFRSRWMAEGGYEPVAERLFNELGVDAFFLEYDTERAGDFSPLRFMPDDKTVVLGLVTSKTPALEPPDLLAHRIDEASRYVPLERLAISPQCGFASVAGGNELTEREQMKKLALLVEVAGVVWGEH